MWCVDFGPSLQSFGGLNDQFIGPEVGHGLEHEFPLDLGAGRRRELIFNSVSNFGNSSVGPEGLQGCIAVMPPAQGFVMKVSDGYPFPTAIGEARESDQNAPKEQRSRCSEKRLSKTKKVFLESPFCPLLA